MTYSPGAGASKAYWDLTCGALGLSNNEYFDLIEILETMSASVRTKVAVPFACKLAYSGALTDNGGDDETVSIIANGFTTPVAKTLTLASSTQAINHLSENVTFNAGDILEIKAATNWSSLENCHLRLVFEST